MTGLVEFLRARLDEDERAALPFRNPQGRAKRWRCDETGGKVRQVGNVEFGLPDVVSESDTHLTAEHIARWDPARVLAEVAAKRDILVEHELVPAEGYRPGHPPGCRVCGRDGFGEVQPDGPCLTLRLLAAPFKDHPDYPGEAS